MNIRETYIDLCGDRFNAACEFARDLMRGDPATFKAGYTAENAGRAAVEMFFEIDEMNLALDLGIALGRATSEE